MPRADRTSGRVLITAVAATLAVLVASAAPPQGRWLRIDSPNFVVIGEVDAQTLRDVADKFEGFREVLGRILNSRVNSAAVPTVVYVFPSDRAFTPFKPRVDSKRIDAAGLFVPRRDVNYIAVIHDDQPWRFRVIFHEYAHLVIANTGVRVPVWLDEGLAEYYSTFEMGSGGRYAEIGHVIGPHLQVAGGLTVLSLPELLSVTHESPLYNEGNRRSVFYAKAWALTHFILQSQPSLGPQLGVYLAELNRGAPQTEAWQKAFGKQDVEGDLDRYIRRGSFTATQYKFGERVAASNANTASLAPADAQAFLADLSLQIDQPKEASERLVQAAKLESGNVRTKLVEARVEIAARQYDRSVNDLRALPVSEDWLLDYLAGVSIATAAEGRQFPPTADDLQAARRLLHRAPAGRDPFPNAMARMAALEVYSTAGPSVGTRVVIERARALAPGRHDYALLHAQVLSRLSEFAAARAVLGPLMTPAYPKDIRDAARGLMGRIVELEAGPSRVDSSGTRIRPAVREVRPGEQRLEGVLESIECGAGGSAIFRIKAGTETTSVSSPRLTDVDFITYRSDFKGSVTCGPMKPPMPVYVTWRAGATAGSRIAVAIEFLAK